MVFIFIWHNSQFILINLVQYYSILGTLGRSNLPIQAIYDLTFTPANADSDQRQNAIIIIIAGPYWSELHQIISFVHSYSYY